MDVTIVYVYIKSKKNCDKATLRKIDEKGGSGGGVNFQNKKSGKQNLKRQDETELSAFWKWE